jgi:transposase InsO family protein
MCKVLGIARSTYYYEVKIKDVESEEAIEAAVIEVFNSNRRTLGARKIKRKLTKLANPIVLSKRKIRKIMKKHNLISSYNLKGYKPQKSAVNEAVTANVLNREFDREVPLDVIVTDLTYVRVGNVWNYVCLILDLFNREIIGYSAGNRKDAELVQPAIATIDAPLTDVNIFHTDCGKEFDNAVIDELLETFNIQRSLSVKGTPYDNAVAESTYKSFKKKFVYQEKFDTLNELRLELFDYVNWWNNHRPHGTLNYLTPIEYKTEYLAALTK